MPFDSESARLAGSKGGAHRWRGKDPATTRRRLMQVKLTDAEVAMITDKAEALHMTRPDLIVAAVKRFSLPDPLS